MNPTLSAADIARGKPVPWVIAAFFAGFTLPLLFFVWIAFQHKPDLVTEHAYDKGLAYNQTLQSEAAMEALGWRTKLAVEGGSFIMSLADKDGKPIHDANARAWFIRPAKAGMDQSAVMHETAPGRYVVAMSALAPGLWQMRVTVEYEGKQFQAARDFSLK